MNRRAKLTLLIVSILLSAGIKAAEIISAPVAGLKVNFLGDKFTPGKLTNFPSVSKTAESLENAYAAYFLGYNSEYLYIYIEAEGDSLVLRDRGYQNGDGFHLTIGRAGDDGADTDEFYVLGFSAKDGWSRKMSWYYNVDLKMGSLGDDVKFKTFIKEGKICFETLIPWSIIKPYHPWLGNKIGFNLCFVKAVNEYDKIYNFIVPDNKMQSEQSGRKYIELSFENPGQTGKTYSLPQRHNYRNGDELKTDIAGFAKKSGRSHFSLTIEDNAKKVVAIKTFEIKIQKGEFRRSLSYGSIVLSPGDYYVRIKENGSEIGLHRITIIEEINLKDALKSVESAKGKVSNGTLSTLKFRITETEIELEKLKPYESCGKLNSSIAQLKQSITLLQSGIDPLSGIRGTFRRAYTSQIDSAIRPYSVYVPEGYDKSRKYPLLVYLHGSGQDDRILERSDFIKEGFIVVAPNGRGVSNCYYSKESQQDIKEAIDDVEREFSIDPQRVVLSGFSMGGYGVFRTFYENPSRYSAIAILSGHPDLASKMVTKNSINFSDKKYLQSFYKIPVFIYHSKDDLNCPYILMKEVADNLKSAGSDVSFAEDENRGHGNMSPEAKEKYISWLQKIQQFENNAYLYIKGN